MFDSLSPYLSGKLTGQPAEVEWLAEALELHQAAQSFRLEVERRQTQAEYCQWYYEMARQTQADHAAMANDINFLVGCVRAGSWIESQQDFGSAKLPYATSP